MDIKKFLHEGYVEISKCAGEIKIGFHINFYELEDFVKELGYDAFCEGGLDVELHYETIYINATDLDYFCDLDFSVFRDYLDGDDLKILDELIESRKR